MQEGGGQGVGAGPAWVYEFGAFTWQHGATLAWTLPLMVGSCVLGRRWLGEGARGVDKEHRLSAAWGGFVLGVNVWSLVYWMMPERIDVRMSLPLQLCDLAGLVSPWVFLTGWRPARALTYFWGIGLSTQAFITPTLEEGVGTMRYWVFWLMHLGIVGSAGYDVAVRGYRPTWGDLWLAVGVSMAWAAGVVVLNESIGANYGYLGSVGTSRATVMDHLGAWPWRIAWAALIGTAVMVGMWGAWGLAGRLRRGGRNR